MAEFLQNYFFVLPPKSPEDTIKWSLMDEADKEPSPSPAHSRCSPVGVKDVALWDQRAEFGPKMEDTPNAHLSLNIFLKRDPIAEWNKGF